VFNEERGMDKRSAFIVDGEGKIRWSKEYAQGTIPESPELLAELKKL
jgi:alkyl hydroperoxide reductase subunit AhpC